MGALISRETRKISFDNNFELPPVVPIDNSFFKVEDRFADLNNPMKESSKENIYNDMDLSITEESDNEYWAKRMTSLKNEHQLINKIIQTEYENTLKNTRDIFVSPSPTPEQIQKVKPCLDWRSRVLKCYEDNPHQPLKCAPLVQAFCNCVTSCHGET